jgi:hypothetical protein
VSTATLLPIASGRRTRAQLKVLVRPLRRRLAGAMLLMIAGTVAGLVTPPLLGHIVDLATAGGSTADLVLAGVELVAGAARSALPEFVRAMLTIVLTLAGMAVLDWRFLAAALIAVPVQAYTVRWYARRAVPLYARQRIAVADQQHHLLATIDGAPTIRAFRLAPEHGDRVAAKSGQAVDLLLRGVHQPTAGRVEVTAGEVALITQEVHVFAGPLGDDLRLVQPGGPDHHAAVRVEVGLGNAGPFGHRVPQSAFVEAGDVHPNGEVGRPQ